MDNLYLIMFIGLSFFMLFLFFYILKVEKTIENKLKSFEISIENINREIFLLKKEIKNSSTFDKLNKLESIVDSIVDDIRKIDNKNAKMISSLKAEIKSLYSEMKRFSIPETNLINKNDESKIISLYKSGYSIEDISKELRIPAGEVELIVKLAKS